MKKPFRMILIMLTTSVSIFTLSCNSKDEEDDPIVPETVMDIDGNVYQTLVVGNQVWMAENLKTTRYNDGSAIPLITDKEEWNNLATPGYCFHSNDSVVNKDLFGALYNWYAVNSGKLAPEGWRVPTQDDWTALIDFLGGASNAGGKLKETSLLHWQAPNEGATDEIGFKALPAGFRSNAGSFYVTGYLACWWANTLAGTFDALSYTVSSGNATIDISSNNKGNGYSVRCIKE